MHVSHEGWRLDQVLVLLTGSSLRRRIHACVIWGMETGSSLTPKSKVLLTGSSLSLTTITTTSLATSLVKTWGVLWRLYLTLSRGLTLPSKGYGFEPPSFRIPAAGHGCTAGYHGGNVWGGGYMQVWGGGYMHVSYEGWLHCRLPWRESWKV